MLELCVNILMTRGKQETDEDEIAKRDLMVQ